ncbi:MAG: LacI family transcriptional regulator [Pseudobutyrivibrio sp.]|nr:LacI family transcriptional regulator [Pseudobutyrivibrio sp.]
MAVSIRDVAKAAGVSIGTVSRAFNGYSDIKDETRDKIIRSAKELGYVPNLSAKMLSGKAHRSMAVILSGFMVDRGLTEELVIKMLHGALEYGQEQNVEFAVYALSSDQQREKSFDQFLAEHSLAGAMVFGLKTSDAYYENIATSGAPCVLVDIEIKGEKVGFVGTDDHAAFAEITDLVIESGHRRIALFNGRKQAKVCELRQKGFLDSLKKHGLKAEEIAYTDFNLDQSQQMAMDYIKENGKTKATAFVCASDLIALGVCNAIRKSGYVVGKDFAVTGFDGLRIANLSDPAVTTVDQNMEKKGYAAAQMLHAIVEGKETERKLLIPYTVLKYDSI